MSVDRQPIQRGGLTPRQQEWVRHRKAQLDAEMDRIAGSSAVMQGVPERPQTWYNVRPRWQDDPDDRRSDQR